MSSGLPKVRTGWKSIYVLAFLVFLGAVGTYTYSYLQEKSYNNKITKEQEKINVLNNDISVAQKDERFVKYTAAKDIIAKNAISWWWDRISRIMNVFSKLQQLWGANIRFSDFSLDYEGLSLKGTVSDLKLVYGKWWVVDMFNELEFLDEITVPTYQKSEDGFVFSLAAKVLLNNVSN